MSNRVLSRWLQRAKSFIEEGPKNGNDGKWHTVNYLISNNHCDINNRIDINSILRHLHEKGIDLDRERFQQSILSELKREGILATLVYPGPNGGVFIPSNENEVKKVANQILRRIVSEIDNVCGVLKDTQYERSFSDLLKNLKRVKNELGD